MPFKGVVSYISNFSYLSDPSFVVMRQRFLKEFDALWFDCLNGDSRETGKTTPEGKPDPSIFSTEYNREGIRVGTAISLMVRKEIRTEQPIVRFRQFWGVTKRADLLSSLNTADFGADYQPANPDKSNRYSFRPSDVSAHYQGWPRLMDLCTASPGNGLMEKRGGALMDINRTALEQRMQMYYDPSVGWDALAALNTGLTKDAAGFDARKVRPKVQVSEQYQSTRLRRYALRPFDTRWCYYSDVSPLWNRSRPPLWAQCWPGNAFLLTRFKGAAEPEGSPCFFTPYLSDDHFLTPDAVAIPIRIRSLPAKKGKQSGQADLFSETLVQDAPTANLSPAARAYLAALGIADPDADAETAGLIWMHALAIGYSPAYLTENADGIRQDWPRVPLPADRDMLLASAALGRHVAALLDTKQPVPGVTTGAIRPELREIGLLRRVDGGNYMQPDDLAVTAGWGHGGKGGVTMPGKGRLTTRDYTAAEHTAINSPLPQAGEGPGSPYVGADCLGTDTRDVSLNGVAYWANVPARVWEYTIGGYQVMKKWLSYREQPLLGRPLTPEEARDVTRMARRIAALLLLTPALDANYQAVKAAAYAWPEPRLS